MKLLKEMERRRKRISKKVGPKKFVGLCIISSAFTLLLTWSIFSKPVALAPPPFNIIVRFIGAVYAMALYNLILYKPIYEILFRKKEHSEYI